MLGLIAFKVVQDANQRGGVKRLMNQILHQAGMKLGAICEVGFLDTMTSYLHHGW